MHDNNIFVGKILTLISKASKTKKTNLFFRFLKIRQYCAEPAIYRSTCCLPLSPIPDPSSYFSSHSFSCSLRPSLDLITHYLLTFLHSVTLRPPPLPPHTHTQNTPKRPGRTPWNSPFRDSFEPPWCLRHCSQLPSLPHLSLINSTDFKLRHLITF